MTQMILVGTIIFIGLLALSLAPLFNPKERHIAQQVKREHTVQDLNNQLDRLFESIRDLDFDYDTHKLTDEIYEHQRKMLVGRGVSVLMRLDQHQDQAPVDTDLDYLIEEQIALRRANLNGGLSVDEVIEAEISARREKVS